MGRRTQDRLDSGKQEGLAGLGMGPGPQACYGCAHSLSPEVKCVFGGGEGTGKISQLVKFCLQKP